MLSWNQWLAGEASFQIQVLCSSLTWEKSILFMNSTEMYPQNRNLEGTTRKSQFLQNPSESFTHLDQGTIVLT